jgi:glycosyltransferase involved in cell wall biosynthesis
LIGEVRELFAINLSVQLNMHEKPGLHLGIDATNIRQGGGVTHLSQLLQAGEPVVAGIHHVTVWTCHSTAAVLPVRPWLVTRSAPWMDARLPRRILGQQFQLPRDLVAAGCDVLFSPGGTLPSRCRVPAVTMSQNMLPFEPTEAVRFGRLSLMCLKMRLLRYTQGRSFRSADGLIFLTQYAETVVSRAMAGALPTTALIPHGIEPRFLQAPRPQRPLALCSAEKPFRVLYVSIMLPYKHQCQVAHAASQLRSEGMPIQMRFIGARSGNYGDQFRVLLDKLDPKHEFLLWSGAEPFDALHDCYQNSDVFVFASSCENLPNILIEAMAAGLPIASSDRGPMPEVLGNAGVYFNPEEPTSIADALRKLAINPPLRADLAASAWLKAQAYSWERCASDTFGFIADVAKKSA